VAGDWHASAETVAIVNGALGGVVMALGCLAGGWLCDRMDRKAAYCVFGALQLLSAVAMAVSARTPAQFVAWTTIYGFITGLTYAGFSAVVLEAIGRTAAATKYSLLASLANMPIAYVTLINGYANDRWGTRGMLFAEAACGVVGILVFAGLAGATRRGRTATTAQEGTSISA
jgi:MFS family permease